MISDKELIQRRITKKENNKMDISNTRCARIGMKFRRTCLRFSLLFTFAYRNQSIFLFFFVIHAFDEVNIKWSKMMSGLSLTRIRSYRKHPITLHFYNTQTNMQWIRRMISNLKKSQLMKFDRLTKSTSIRLKGNNCNTLNVIPWETTWLFFVIKIKKFIKMDSIA